MTGRMISLDAKPLGVADRFRRYRGSVVDGAAGGGQDRRDHRAHYLVVMELIFAATGVELRGVVDSMGEGPQRTFAAVRSLVNPLDDDREMSTDMTRVARMVAGPRY